MKVLLLQLDGKLPNLALMRLAAHHRGRGDYVELRHAADECGIEPRFGDKFDVVYGSAIFTRTRDLAEHAAAAWFPSRRFSGGTGIDPKIALAENVGPEPDYSDYPNFRQSLGFTRRGCRLKCPFCVVPSKEGAVREENTIEGIWRGEPWPRELLLLDNDFFGQPRWRDRIDELHAGHFKVSFNQGINARFLTDETAAALASVDYRDDQIKT